MDELKKIDDFTYTSLGQLLEKMVPQYNNFPEIFEEQLSEFGGYLFMNAFADKFSKEFESFIRIRYSFFCIYKSSWDKF
ncbi:MAG: hypothetical protein C5B52_09425 [Bacteroidetes bacterium]|nr:MAG: hypothetical protein C5B52_09425 [Bacteroidota bacterium]